MKCPFRDVSKKDILPPKTKCPKHTCLLLDIKNKIIKTNRPLLDTKNKMIKTYLSPIGQKMSQTETSPKGQKDKEGGKKHESK